ncbi:MAG: hypothetical protein M9939_19415 [Mesorhizobium sp.]|nr:hypothetical protein [Mesorhizobium sp.]MCO5163306.1 hypothetical protein [Mesorhizobium sp.]
MPGMTHMSKVHGIVTARQDVEISTAYTFTSPPACAPRIVFATSLFAFPAAATRANA